jgi:hypothetical protein
VKYTNGFDIDVVLPALQQRLGWIQPTVDGSPVLNAANLNAISSRYFNDGSFHASATIQNIKNSQEDPLATDAQINTFLSTYQNSEIMRALNEVFRERELIEQALMYTRFGFNDFSLPNQNQWVGWLIETVADQSYSTQIEMATFYFDKDVTFNIYLFQDGVRQPLNTLAVNVTAYQRTEVDFDTWVLPFKTGKRYYVLYNQAELGTARAIREQVDGFATTYCFTAYPVQFYPTTDGSYFNINNRQYPAQPAGLNLEIISFRDHTQKILRKVNLFDEVQGLQMAAMVLELINTSTRTNSGQRTIEQQSNQMYMDLNQAFATKEVPVTPGLKSRIAAEFKKLKETFYPTVRAISTNMEPDFNGMDMYESNWMLQNARVQSNPGMIIT